MSGEEQRRLAESVLLNTDDAMVWAEEFTRIFNGRTIVSGDTGGTDNEFIDAGTMVGWFAAAMLAALNVAERRRTNTAAHQDESDPLAEAFVEGFEDGREPER